MSLEDLNDQLHSRDSHLDKARFGMHEEHTEEELSKEREAFQKKEEWQSPTQEIYLVSPDVAKARKKKLVIAAWSVGTLVVLGTAAFVGYLYLKRQSAVSVSVTGPASVASVEEVGFKVNYENQSWSEADNVTLTLTLPESFRIKTTPEMKMVGKRVEISLGALPRGITKTLPLNGQFYGGKGEKGTIEAVLRYTPKGTSSQYETKSQLEVTLATSPLLFEASAPSEVASGQAVDYVINYENQSPEIFHNLRVIATYPEDFQYISSEGATVESNNTWLLADLKPHQTGKIVIHGNLGGVKESAKTFTAKIGILQGDNTLLTYNTIEKKTQIIGTPLTISQLVNGNNDAVVNPGDTLRYTLKYKNDSAIGMRDVIVMLGIDTNFLDVSRLELTNGFYDQTAKKIIWKASDIPALAQLEPGQAGEIIFTIPVVKEFPAGSNPKNIVIRSMATIDSPDVKTTLTGNKTIASNLLQLKVGALVGLQITPYFTGSAFQNSGPVPPVVGSETTYTLKTKVSSSSNDLTQARIRLVMPSGVVYKGVSSPSGETVEYNERTNELIWQIGVLAAGKEKQFEFQVGITPNASQVNKDVELMRAATFTAKESFTQKEVKTEKQAVTNFLQDDKGVTDQSGVVKNP